MNPGCTMQIAGKPEYQVVKIRECAQEGIGGSEPRDPPSPRLRGEGRGEGSSELTPHPKPALCAASDLSPQAARGDSRHSIQRNGALTGDRERLKKRNGTKTIGRGQGHRSIRRAGADA